MAIKILVVEDEKRMYNYLKKMLLKIDPGFAVEGPITGVAELRDVLQSGEHYDLLISDVRINGGTCFNAFEVVQPTMPVIFVTAYDEYALKAFKNNGVAYVQKPVEEQELREALEKAKKMLSPQDDISKLLAMLQPPAKQYRERFLIPRGEQYQIVNSFAISHFEVEGKTTVAYLDDGSKVFVQESMNELENELDPKMFFRCSRQYIINIEDIVRIDSTWNAKLILKLRRYPEKDFEVSRDRVKELKEKLNQ